MILFVASVFDSTKDYENFLSLNPQVPHIIALNKVDLTDNATLLKKLSEYANLANILKLSFLILLRKKAIKKAY